MTKAAGGYASANIGTFVISHVGASNTLMELLASVLSGMF
jgi:hypothetical protein